MNWREAVAEALQRYSSRHATKYIRRQELIQEELDRIIQDTDSHGETPHQTLSRILQELRDAGELYFLGDGNYVLATEPISIEQEDLPLEALDLAVEHNNLRLGILPAADQKALARRRLGQQKLRDQTLINYAHQCALCDINDSRLLIAGHILRWADSPETRGDLRNLVCMCRLHDALFEEGYFSLADDYRIIRKPSLGSQMILLVLKHTHAFRPPSYFPPAIEYLRGHRVRTGLQTDAQGYRSLGAP